MELKTSAGQAAAVLVYQALIRRVIESEVWSNTPILGHQLLLLPAHWRPVFASRATHAGASRCELAAAAGAHRVGGGGGRRAAGDFGGDETVILLPPPLHL